jgi:hypothetical protein
LIEKTMSDELPKELECLTGRPEEVLEKLFAKGLERPEARDVLAGLVSGMGVKLGVEVPPWAAKASERFFESCKLGFIGKTDEVTPKQVGTMVGLWDGPVPDKGMFPEILTALDIACKLARTSINDDPPVVARDFHAGRMEAEKIGGIMEELPQRTKIYMLLAINWRKVAGFKSTTQLWEWLLSLENNGAKVIAPSTDSREIRTVCQMIGLRYKSPFGKTPKQG